MFETSVDSVLCFQTFFFNIKCAPFLSKLAQGFKYWLPRKTFKIAEIHFKNKVECICFKHVFDVENYESENMLKIILYFYFIQNMGE